MPWTVVDGPESAAALPTPCSRRRGAPSRPNAIGNALAAAQALIEANAFEGYRKVIDFSGEAPTASAACPWRRRGARRLPPTS